MNFLWGLLAPIVGPIVLAVRGLLPGFSVASVIMPAIVMVGVAIVAWGGYRLLTRPAGPDVVTVDHVRANRLAAENAALKRAIRERESVLREREAELAGEINALNIKLQAAHRARLASSEGSGQLCDPVLLADDAWVRAKR